MVRNFGLATSRVLESAGKSLQLLVSRSGKAITDTEGIVIQDLQTLKLAEVLNANTFSGCVDLPQMRIAGPSDPSTLAPSTLIIPPFRALVADKMALVHGSNNFNAPTNLDNYLTLPTAPSTGYAVCVVYLEVWNQVLDQDVKNTTAPGFYLPTPYISGVTPRYYYPYGNILAKPSWITIQAGNAYTYLDDLNDPLIGYTSGRVQLQYALRVAQIIPGTTTPPITEYIKDFVMTHPSISGQSLYVTSNITTAPFVYQGQQDPGLFKSNFAYKNVDSATWAIPLAVIFQRNQTAWSPTSNPFGAGKSGNPSGRPDGKYYDALSMDDLIDTRSAFLGGSMEDYESTIRQAASRLWKGTLRLKIAEVESQDVNAHQVGQNLLSQEIIGPYLPAKDVSSPIPTISDSNSPRASWVSDNTPEILSYQVPPQNKDASSNSVATMWVNGDTLTITHPDTSVQIETVLVYTYNTQGMILRVPAAYLGVSGIGTNSIVLTLFNIGVDIRFDLTQSLWVNLSIVRSGSVNTLRYVPEKLHTPIYYNGSALPCGKVSDYAPAHEDSSPLNSLFPIRSYKRGFDSNMFGTVRRFQVPISNMISYGIDTTVVTNQAPVVNLSQGTQAAEIATVQLTWSISNAVRATMFSQTVIQSNSGNPTVVPLGDVPLTGSMSVRVSEATTYTITAYNANNSTTTQIITVTPPSDLVGGSVTTGQAVTRAYVNPGGALNPENVAASVSETTMNIPFSPGFGDTLNNVMLGCIKATYFYMDQNNNYQETDLKIHHQHFATATSSQGIIASKVGVFGDFSGDANPNDYIEFELLVTNLKTFHYNPTVKGITAVTETICPSQNAYLFFSQSDTTPTTNYAFSTFPDYINGAINCVVSSISRVYSDTPFDYNICGIFEGVFGFNGQSYVFVNMSGNSYYQAVPCEVQGIGTSLLSIVIPQIAIANVVDILVLAQTTSVLDSGSTTLLSYDYIPYQGEGDPNTSYSLVHLNKNALVTTSGTGGKYTPGFSGQGAINPLSPVAAVLPAVTGWQDSDLTGVQFSLNGSYVSEFDSTTDFVETPLQSTMWGNITDLMNISAEGTPALVPKQPTQRGFSNNQIGFTYSIETPVFDLEPSQNLPANQNSLIYYVDSLQGDDSNSGLSRTQAKKSLQTMVNSLPAVISIPITIYVNGTSTIADDTLNQINLLDVVPYGSPDLTQLYAIIHTAFNTVGNGSVTICKDPTLNDFVQIQVPPVASFGSTPLYGWIHTAGKLNLSGISFASGQGVCFAAYPQSLANLTLCNFSGGSVQLLAYGSNVEIDNISFSNALGNHVIASSGANIISGANVAFTKGTATGYTLTIEKNSTMTVNTSFASLSGYPITPQTEILVRQYSTFDTHRADLVPPIFTFSVGKIRLTSFSTLIYHTNKWFTNMLDVDSTIDSTANVNSALMANPTYLIVSQ